jgi:CRISPR-associated protein Csy2
LARLPRNGCWISPSSIKVNNFTDLIEHCFVDSSKKPAMLGFLLLEEPTVRRGSIAEEHAFVEPVLGIVECSSPVGVRFNGAQRFFSQAFWRLEGENSFLLMEKA